MDLTEIRAVLQKLGERVPVGSALTLVGGSALALLGNARLTIDIDFWGDDIHPNFRKPACRLLDQQKRYFVTQGGATQRHG